MSLSLSLFLSFAEHAVKLRIDLLLKALLGIQDDPAEDQENENVMQGRRVVFFTPNCATAHVGLRPDGSVAVYHIGQSAKL